MLFMVKHLPKAIQPYLIAFYKVMQDLHHQLRYSPKPSVRSWVLIKIATQSDIKSLWNLQGRGLRAYCRQVQAVPWCCVAVSWAKPHVIHRKRCSIRVLKTMLSIFWSIQGNPGVREFCMVGVSCRQVLSVLGRVCPRDPGAGFGWGFIMGAAGFGKSCKSSPPGPSNVVALGFYTNYGYVHKLRVLSVGALLITAILFGVDIRAPYF